MLSIVFAESLSGWENVQAANGTSVAISGLIIVFVALTLISVFISLLPSVLEKLDPWLPKATHHHVYTSPTPEEQVPADEEKIIAAIGYVLHTEMQKATNA